ncbi:MAG: RNA polymerase factor sigma-54 [Desulfobacterales bacterium]|jgi:RNA polymerase sigma-54 factor|nr:RNA polymerase factor sigma-54 [Desulfobacterales bacterium]
MAIELRQQLKLSQQLIMTPQLQMAIKLLQLSRLELMESIQQELEQNPTLEEGPELLSEEPLAEANQVPKEATITKEITIEEKIREDIDWSNYMDEYNSPGRSTFESEAKDSPQFEAFIALKETLSDHLLWQLMMTKPSALEEQIGSFIIGSINSDGYLEVDIEEIAQANACEPYLVETVLHLMQTFDPIGVCAKDLKECLLLQARHLNLDNTVVTEIISHHLHHLENKNYKAISKALKVSLNDVISAVHIIQGLEPRPGLQFSAEEPQYIIPDIYVYKLDNEFVIVLNDDGMPKLRVNNFYKKAVNREEAITGKTRDYIQEKLRSAAWLIRSIHQRQKTIYRVMESILKFQSDFFEKGIAYLKPMVLRDVALDISMHESTISRVTTNKYAYTPQGIFELKYFFNSSINRFHGEAIASASVQDKIKQIIDSENPKRPYSDSKIADMLEAANINIARRTVAKYREMMRVLPSNKRKQY